MRAHAPGSVTGLFAPALADGEASRGASFAIEDGVVVDVTPGTETTITVDGEPASFEPVECILADLDVAALVDILPEIPLGHGFGASGAATLATALAANAAFDLGKSRESLTQAAHRAEMQAGTGQGDVFIQERGGLLWSGNGEVHRSDPDELVEYATTGGISTAEMLADESFMAAARRSGHRHLDGLGSTPTLRRLAKRSRAYLDETGLGTEFVEREIERVEAAGGAASMALFGETVFGVGVEGVLASDASQGSSDRRSDGVLANRTRVSTVGAQLLSDDDGG